MESTPFRAYPQYRHFGRAQRDMRCTNFHCVKKLKPIGTALSQNYYYICQLIHLTHPITMSKTFIDKAYAVVSEFENRKRPILPKTKLFH